jgi:molybdopterin/thiamine biosynthesis adenylyltransferase
LSDSERERFRRQIAIEGFGESGQEKLRAARVFVAGAGGLGCAVAIYLAAAGIGKLRIADRGDVELSNLNRQVAYGDRDIGSGKTERLAAWIADFNPELGVEPLRVDMDQESLPDLVRGCDLIIDALDNLSTRFALNAAALRQKIPLVHGAVLGFCGQLMTVLPGKSACLMCLYRGMATSGTIPVMGVAPGVIGSLQATEAIKLLSGLGRPVTGRLIVFDGLEMSFTELEIPRDPECPQCGGSSSRDTSQA